MVQGWARRNGRRIALALTFGVTATSAAFVCAGGPREEAEAERCRRATELAAKNIPLPFRPTSETAPVYLRVAGVRYAIPANYFRYPPIGCGTEEGGFLVRVLLPGFEGWSKDLDRAFNNRPGEPNMTMNLLFEIRPADPGMRRSFGAFAPDADPDAEHPQWDGLLQTKNRFADDVYFLREGNDITFLMICGEVRLQRYPGCTQHFWYRGAKLKMTFRRTQLEHWRAIQAGGIALLDGFLRAASDQESREGGDHGSDFR